MAVRRMVVVTLLLFWAAAGWAIDATTHLGFTQPERDDVIWDVPQREFHRGVDLDLSRRAFLVTDPRFNARCNGTTDDTAAIQAAESAADDVGGVVLIPPATCVGKIVLSSNVTLAGVGAGSRLKAPAALGNVPMVQSELEPSVGAPTQDVGIHVRDLTLDGSSNTTGTTDSPCILYRATLDSTVSNVRCLQPKGDCVTFTRTGTATILGKNNDVDGLFCDRPARSGFASTSGRHMSIARFHVYRPVLHGVNLELESEANLSIDDVTIGPGTVEGLGTAALKACVNLTTDTATHTLKNVTIDDVVCDRNGIGIGLRGVSNVTIGGGVVINAPGIDGVFTYTHGTEPLNAIVKIDAEITAPGGSCLNWDQTGAVTFTGICKGAVAGHGLRLANSVGAIVKGATVDMTAAGFDCVNLADTSDGVVFGNVLRCGRDGVRLGGTTATTGMLIAVNRIIAGGKPVNENGGGTGVNANTVLMNDVTGSVGAFDLTGDASTRLGNKGDISGVRTAMIDKNVGAIALTLGATTATVDRNTTIATGITSRTLALPFVASRVLHLRTAGTVQVSTGGTDTFQFCATIGGANCGCSGDIDLVATTAVAYAADWTATVRTAGSAGAVACSLVFTVQDTTPITVAVTSTLDPVDLDGTPSTTKAQGDTIEFSASHATNQILETVNVLAMGN